MLKKKRIKILARRNLKMSAGKLAAQSVHAALGLAALMAATPEDLVVMANLTCVVLEASDQKFNQEGDKQIADNNRVYIFYDAGYTEVEPNTVTCMAFLEDDPKEVERA